MKIRGDITVYDNGLRLKVAEALGLPAGIELSSVYFDSEKGIRAITTGAVVEATEQVAATFTEPAPEPEPTPAPAPAEESKRKPGRPAGSKNKPKDEPQVTQSAPASAPTGSAAPVSIADVRAALRAVIGAYKAADQEDAGTAACKKVLKEVGQTELITGLQGARFADVIVALRAIPAPAVDELAGL